jgi:uncharacterized pyridoxamine 5'-phosphate oxidase family protein
MYETPDDIQRLQQILDRSIEHAGAFIRESFEMPGHSLSARQLVHFWQGLQTVAFATVTARGEPRVAPIGALLLRGRFAIPTVAAAVRTRHVQRQPAISFTLYQANSLAVIVHGEAVIVRQNHPEFAEFEAFQREVSGTSVLNWGEGVFLLVMPKTIYTYAHEPENYADLPQPDPVLPG